MVGLAFGMLVIIVVAGKPEAPERRAAATSPTQPSNPDRVREYQDRLRALEAQATQEEQAATASPTPAGFAPPQDSGGSRPEDPIVAERRRREYESLFAGNVVMSRRPAHERPDSTQAMATARPADREGASASPSIDEIADAAMRAAARAGGVATAPAGTGSQMPAPEAPQVASTLSARAVPTTPLHTDAISAVGPLHRILEGTLIDTALTNRLDGSSAAPVNCLVTNPIYSHTGRVVLIPAGARLLGETKPVQALGETRLAVAFHRLIMPDGSTFSLNQFLGLNQIGDAGLRDRVNHHYLSMFGAAAAVGLISGFAQFLGTTGLNQGNGDRTVVVAGGAADATAQAGLQVMNRFLNRLPTITIREGHRVRVYITSDLELPAYPPDSIPRF
jgi:type IV secretion system protein VirB10